MMASPSTSPGKTSGIDAMLSSSHRPRIFVRTTIQAMTADTSITAVALPSASTRLFHTVCPNCG